LPDPRLAAHHDVGVRVARPDPAAGPETRRAVVLRPFRDRGPVAPRAPGGGGIDAGAAPVPDRHGCGDAVRQPHLLAVSHRPQPAAEAAPEEGRALGRAAEADAVAVSGPFLRPLTSPPARQDDGSLILPLASLPRR